MGADFLCVTCPRFQPTASRLKQLRRHVRELPATEIATLAEERGWKPAEVKAVVLNAIKELPELDSRRDVGTICCDGAVHWITGGMSSGESPTDAYDILDWLTLVPSVLERMQRWAQADYAAELQEAS
jgi:hypothetical protein